VVIFYTPLIPRRYPRILLRGLFLLGGCRKGAGFQKRSADENPITVRLQGGEKGQKQAKRGQKWDLKKSLLRFFIVFEVENSYLEGECVFGLSFNVLLGGPPHLRWPLGCQ
jgi:hypothetical protein